MILFKNLSIMLLIFLWSITGLAQALTKTNRLRIDLGIETGIPPGDFSNLKLNPGIGISYMFGHFGFGVKTSYFSVANTYNMAGYETTLSNFIFMKNPKNVSFYTKNRIEQLPSRFIFIGFGPRYQLFGNCSRFNIELGLTPFYMKTTKPEYLINMNNVLSGRIKDFNLMTTTYPENFNEQVVGIVPDLQIQIGLDKARHWSLLGSIEFLYVASVNEFTINTRDLTKASDVDNEKFLYSLKDLPFKSETFKQVESKLYANVGIRFSFGKCESTKSSYIPPSVNNYGINDEGHKKEKEEGKKDEKEEKNESYLAPQAINPADGSSLSEVEAKSPVAFRWSPVVPKPKVDVIYKLKVFEIRQGKTAPMAIKETKPIFEKELTNRTQLEISSLSVIPIAKDSKYGWYVQATNIAGNPFGENNGTSNPTTFKIGEDDINILIDSLKVECCENNKQQIKLTIRNDRPNSNTILKKITITTVNGNGGTPYPIDISSSITPPLPFSYLPSSTSTSLGRKNFTALVDCNMSMNNLIVKAFGERNTNLGTVEDNDLESDTLNCICKVCDSIQIDIPNNGTISMDSTLTLQTPVIVTPKLVKSIKTQLVYFEYKPESDDCIPCNRDSHDWGNFLGATLNDNDFNANGILNWGHELQWNSTNNNGANLNGNLNFHISLPPLVNCCKAEIKFCIRYIFEFTDCIVCEKVVCYSYSKTAK